MSWGASGPWWNPYTRAAGAAVTHVDLRPNPTFEAKAWEVLDQAELSQWRKFLAAGPRRRFSLCRAALRFILCNRLECRDDELSFGVSRHGKPFALLRGGPSSVGFNVSHSGENGLIAVADGEVRVGVDVEEIVAKRNLESLIEAVMGPDERAQLAPLQGTERLRLFYRIWTSKEALIKALGTGFATDVSQFQIPADAAGQGNDPHTFKFPEDPSVTWGLEDIGNEKFSAALAYELPTAASQLGNREANLQSRA